MLGGIRLVAEIVIQPRLFRIRGVRDVDGDFLAKVLGDLLERQARGLGEEEVDHYRKGFGLVGGPTSIRAGAKAFSLQRNLTYRG